jgi:CDP-diacylglycerol pyrophosphatase
MPPALDGWATAALGLIVGLLAHCVAAQAADPNVLWQIVHDQCVPDEQQHGDPKPCAEVDLAGGFAVLKDIAGASQFLLIPTAEVGGIEAPRFLRLLRATTLPKPGRRGASSKRRLGTRCPAIC